jgi:hypothetical protein
MVDEYRKDYGKGETCGQAVDTQNQGVSDDIYKVGGSEKPLKMVQARPGAAPYPPHGLVILEGHHNPIHGNIMEDDHIHHRNKEEEVEIQVIPIGLSEI